MERHRCKLCWRRFGSGRALGGHMRSHVMNPSMYLKREVAESDADYSGNLEDEMEMEEGQESSWTESVIQDRESESETSRRVLTGRRSKRLRPGPGSGVSGFGCREKRVKCEAYRSESWTELEQGSSSVSDSTVEEVAFCLMMLSRDTWNIPEDEGVRAEPDSTKLISDKMKYKCETCAKTFTSYQALGGHRASHNKVRLAQNPNPLLDLKNPTQSSDPRLHQCPICHRAFPSGQALGGHKRSHANMVQEIIQPERAPVRCGDIVIDLNFPAPADDLETF